MNVEPRQIIIKRHGGKGSGWFAPPLGDHVEEKEVSQIDMKQEVPGLSPTSFGQENYRGIGKVSYGKKDKKVAMENAKDIDAALSKVPPEHIKGMNNLYVTGGGFLGSAIYIPPNPKTGRASDEIMLMDGWLEKKSSDRQQSLLHEVGHRVQLVIDKKSFSEFERQGLDKYFNDITDAKFAKNYKRNHHASETFAESYARYLMNTEQPEPLNKFWSDRL